MRRDSPLRRAFALAGLVLLGLGAALFMSCTAADEGVLTPTPTRTPRPTLTPVPTLTPTPAWPVTVFIPHGLPAPVGQALQAALDAHPDRLAPAPAPDEADVRVVFNPGDDGLPLAEWTYALVAPFPTVTDDVAWVDLAATWAGSPSGPFAGRPLLMTAETAAMLAAVWGQPGAGAVEIVPAAELLDRAWEAKRAWAIVPFEALEPRWKVLRVDGRSVLDRALDTATYPLTVHVDVAGLERGVEALVEAAGPFQTNRDPQEMAVVLLTGVTALARATALRMERHGPTYPAQDIRGWLLEPDITHISNEVSFAEDCPPPSDYSTMVFCASPAYIELLTDSDVDVVELTGNHVLDWGATAMRFTLGLYNQHGIPYFGGGDDVARAWQPLTLTVGAQTFGFLGCNLVGPEYDWATEASPGSAPCDFERLKGQIRALREEGLIPIVTLQYWEFYQYEPTPQQQRDFRALAEAGAVIVSGNQAHQPQGFDFHNGAFIHYGLGNLFFDQMWSLATRQEFLDRHVFYQGRHISTELLTAILEDYARPRPMSPEERAELLEAVFSASGW